MKFVLLLILAIVGLALLCLVPEYYAEGLSALEGWVSTPIFEDAKIFFIIFALVPILLLIIEEIRADSYFGGWDKIIWYLSILLVCRFAPASGPLTSAFSFLCCIIIWITPIYILFDEIVRYKLIRKIKNKFVQNHLVWVVLTVLTVCVIGLSYILSLFGVWLPSNETFVATLGGLWGFSWPTIISCGFFVGYLILEFLRDAIAVIAPRKTYKHTTNKPVKTLRMCSTCKYHAISMKYGDYCKINGHNISANDLHNPIYTESCSHYEYYIDR